MPWATATDLAEYAYCPRALYYRRQDPSAPELPSAADGRRYHERSLAAERRREARRATAGAGLVLAVVAVGVGLAWALHP